MEHFTAEFKGTWLITGCAGFIGSHLTERLLKEGQRVVGVDNLATGKRANIENVLALVGKDASEQFSFHEVDIRDRAAIQNLFKISPPDVVLHQAALGSVPRSIHDPLTSHEVNVDGFVNVLDTARTSGVKRFVYASSSSVYGDINDDRKVEARLGQLLSPYATTKRANELYAQVYGRTYGMETVGLRYFNVFGPRQDPNGPYAAVIPRWISALTESKESLIYGDGATSRDFCYIDNVVQANIKAGLVMPDSEAINSFVNIACGETTSLTDLWHMLRVSVAERRKIDPATIPNVRYEPFRQGDIKHSRADISLAKSSLGYSPTHLVREGAEELVRSVLSSEA